MASQSNGSNPRIALGGALLGAGGSVTAAAAAVCCAGPAIGPLMVAMLGVGGAAAIAGLRPYSFALLALSGIVIGFSLWRSTRAAKACVPDNPPTSFTISRVILWIAMAVWLAAAAMIAYTFFFA